MIQNEEFGRWLAVDKSGSAHLFKKKPVMIDGLWVPDDFPTGFGQACIKAGVLPHLKGKLFKRRTDGGEYKWEPHEQ